MQLDLTTGRPAVTFLRRIAALTIVLALGWGLAIPARAQTAVFSFDGDRQTTATRLTEVNNGISATFSSPADINGGGFQVEAMPFSTLTGNVLHDRGPSGQQNIPLNIAFSQPLYSITLNFATNDNVSASPLTLTAFLNGQQVGVGSATGAFQASTYAEGTLSLTSASPFNYVTLTSTPAPAFAVNNIRVSSTPVPSVLASLTFPSPASGGTLVTATVTLSGPAQSDTVIGLSSSDSAVVRLHRAVIIPAGSAGATFPISTYRSQVTKTVTIQATLNQVTLTKDLTIMGK